VKAYRHHERDNMPSSDRGLRYVPSEADLKGLAPSSLGLKSLERLAKLLKLP